jgi:hypothetical protein
MANCEFDKSPSFERGSMKQEHPLKIVGWTVLCVVLVVVSVWWDYHYRYMIAKQAADDALKQVQPK